MSAALSIARVSVLRALRRPSSWWLSALAFLPAALGAWLGASGYDALSVPAPLLVYVAAPLLVVPWVAGVLGEAFERRTVIYWFVRPMARPTALLGEWIGATVTVGTVLLLGGAMLAVANALTGNATMASLARLPLAMLAEAFALAGFSVGVGALAPKHPVSVAVGVLAVTEVALPTLWGPMQSISLSRQVLVLAGLDSSAVLPSLVGAAPTPSLPIAALVLAVFVAIPMGLAVRTVIDRDL
ncbi:MAG: hypothetical protein JWM10_1947 [Myxococcaceae bacterium]|nr:hypothetical protein [Myxococcaceae bacterium]